VNGINVFTGKSQLIRVNTQSGKYHRRSESFPVAFLGNNADWIVQIKDALISDLSFQDHIFDKPTIFNGWYADYDSGDEFGYFIAKFREWTTPNQVEWEDYVPFLFVRSIIDKIFQPLGYQIESTFLDSDFFKKLIIPVPLRSYGDEFAQNEINCFVSRATPLQTFNQLDNKRVRYNDDSTGVNFDNGNNYNTTGSFYTIPFTGEYKVNALITISGLTGTPPVGSATLEIRQNGTTVLASTTGINLNTASSAFVSLNTTFLAADVGTSLSVWLITPDGGLGGGGSYSFSVGGSFEVLYQVSDPALGFQVFFDLLLGS
jgi:hypothetical protein